MPSNSPAYMRKQMQTYRDKWDAEGKCKSKSKRCGKDKDVHRQEFKLCQDCSAYLNSRKKL